MSDEHKHPPIPVGEPTLYSPAIVDLKTGEHTPARICPHGNLVPVTAKTCDCESE